MSSQKSLRPESEFPTALKYKFYVLSEFFPDAFRVSGKRKNYSEPVSQNKGFANSRVGEKTISNISSVGKKEGSNQDETVQNFLNFF